MTVTDDSVAFHIDHEMIPNDWKCDDSLCGQVFFTGGCVAGLATVPLAAIEASEFTVNRHVSVDGKWCASFWGTYKKIADGIFEPVGKHKCVFYGLGDAEHPDNPINQRTNVDVGLSIPFGTRFFYQF